MTGADKAVAVWAEGVSDPVPSFYSCCVWEGAGARGYLWSIYAVEENIRQQLHSGAYSSVRGEHSCLHGAAYLAKT